MSLPHAKRQKLRKGTHSCWACKRRKMKCVFDPFDNTICKPCQIRGSKCVSQEFPEDVWTPDTRTGGGNIDTDQGRTPLMSSEDGKRSSYGILTPTSTILTTSASLDFYRSPQVCFQYPTAIRLSLIPCLSNYRPKVVSFLITLESRKLKYQFRITNMRGFRGSYMNHCPHEKSPRGYVKLGVIPLFSRMKS
ncbi:hypothetical protein ACN42_g3570 [Penicillium freii]|uniref:Zn(2)-C6 fungal-type domain-containing protein n=1 Tax=Penicillium freii TaxID=48697 RepID=A0A101MMX0_PENFR|nr:hypothetical protein ACN42_g3570 [Penicillium freii]